MYMHTHTQPVWWTHSHVARLRWPQAQMLPSDNREGRTSLPRPDVGNMSILPSEFFLLILGREWKSQGHHIIPYIALKGPIPLWCPLSWHFLHLGLSFQASIWLFLGWSWLHNMLDVAKPVHLAAQPLQYPGSLFLLSAAPGHLHAPGGDGRGVIEAEGEHGNFKCPVLLETNPPYPNPAGICNHLALTPTRMKQSSPCWGHCASMADGHVCQLPRDLS